MLVASGTVFGMYSISGGISIFERSIFYNILEMSESYANI